MVAGLKRRGRHPDKELTAVRIKSLRQPGRYVDGGGLYLEVDKNGAKRWLLRITVQGRRRDIGLGSEQLVTLAEARDKALDYRRVARAGGDPLAERKQSARAVPTFEAAAEKVHAEHAPSWRNAKHGAQWLTTLKTYAFPVLGSRHVNQIDSADVLRVLAPIWLTKPVTARRVRQRIRTVLDWAKAAGLRAGDNPADLVEKGLPRQPITKEHHSALPYVELPSFVQSLTTGNTSEPIRLALELLILTSTRTGEMLGALQSEFDLEQRVWTIPGNRMKGGREHRIPLSRRAVEIVRRAQELSADSPFLFAGKSPRRPYSSMVFLMALRRMGVNATPHGFRSSFRDWAAETTGFPHEVAEMALAHAVRGKTEAAYRRGDLFEKRRLLMEAWAAYLTASLAKVVPIGRRA